MDGVLVFLDAFGWRVGRCMHPGTGVHTGRLKTHLLCIRINNGSRTRRLLSGCYGWVVWAWLVWLGRDGRDGRNYLGQVEEIHLYTIPCTVASTKSH
jgi:hypothetical protein